MLVEPDFGIRADVRRLLSSGRLRLLVLPLALELETGRDHAAHVGFSGLPVAYHEAGEVRQRDGGHEVGLHPEVGDLGGLLSR